MSKALNVGFSATAVIKRSDFGLGMAAPAVSDEVKLKITAAFEK
jgi:polyisoprenoid-binding protein YceI